MILMFVQALLPLGLGAQEQSGDVVRIGLGMGFVVTALASSLGKGIYLSVYHGGNKATITVIRFRGSLILNNFNLTNLFKNAYT